ncbi:MAG: GTP cyclohydrolase [Planctomycetes bacterium]|nr:GTP cyclohydrolase [Planctomycetota bacterium]
MPLFVITIEYTRPLPEIEAATPDHRAYLRAAFEQGRLFASGPFVPRTGGMLLIKAADAAEAQAFVAGDPFQRRGLASYGVREWNPVINREAFGL